MAYNTITAAPQAGDFTPLAEHLEQTPSTFFGASKPVLHLHCPKAKVAISRAHLAAQPDFAALQGSSAVGGSEDDGALVEICDVDVWASSSHLTLFATPHARGLHILYPTITIHARQGPAVLLELNLSDANTADEDLEFLQLRIVPSAVAPDSDAEPVQALYDAISACQELHPDPNPSDDGEGAVFDETAPGATGWITSENMAEFMDAEGNLRFPEGATVVGGEDDLDGAVQVASLGAGAGRRRGVDEVDAGDAAAGDEGKWQRTG
ncbi:hypothetical protein LTR08_007358 [Meristemomyces frigidus]|nr:hypothetical protein LTR08_007358 [Meristemomyces frigidus]